MDVLRQCSRDHNHQTEFQAEYTVPGGWQNQTVPEVTAEIISEESAQALYLYLAELPATFYRIGFGRLRERLQLTSHIGNQNAIVKKALQQLKDIGFLEYSVEKENGDYVLNILKRNPKL
jgi:hypothetical protein